MQCPLSLPVSSIQFIKFSSQPPTTFTHLPALHYRIPTLKQNPIRTSWYQYFHPITLPADYIHFHLTQHLLTACPTHTKVTLLAPGVSIYLLPLGYVLHERHTHHPSKGHAATEGSKDVLDALVCDCMEGWWSHKVVEEVDATMGQLQFLGTCEMCLTVQLQAVGETNESFNNVSVIKKATTMHYISG